MIAFAFALGAWLWAMPYLLVGAGIILLTWLAFRELRRQGEKEIAERRAKRDTEREIVDRMMQQHNLRMQGDPRGVYGVATPAVKHLARMERRR